MKTSLVRFPAAIAATIALIAVPGVASAETTSATGASAQLLTAIAASNEAYASGVVSQIRGVNSFTADTNAPEVTEYTAGVTGKNLFSDPGELDLAWQADDSGVSFAARGTSAGVIVSQRLSDVFATWERSNIGMPDRVEKAIVADVASKGGSLDSQVVTMTLDASDWAIWESIAYTANPAAALEFTLAIAGQYSVTSEATSTGGTRFVVTSPSDSGVPENLTVLASAAGVIDRLEWDGEFAGWISVTASGKDVVVPSPAALAAINTPLLNAAVSYRTSMDALAITVNLTQSFIARGKVSKKAIYAGLKKAGVLSDETVKVTAQRTGYRISVKLTQEEKAFGPLCTTFTAVRGKLKVTHCS